MHTAILLCVCTLFCQAVVAQSIWPTQVVDHSFGNNQTVGQSPEVFPENVLGPVATVASTAAPANAPEDVVSLGRDGYITFGFDVPILDWPGADFTVFENPFIYGSNFVFDEWLKVEVSADGVNFTSFVFDTLTGTGLAGQTPTTPLAGGTQNPALAGGDAYDLADLGIDTVRYIRLTDMTRYQTADRLSAEVDGIRIWRPGTVGRAARLPQPTVIRTARGYRIELHKPVENVQLMDATGRRLNVDLAYPQTKVITLSMSDLPSGVYLLRLDAHTLRLMAY